MHTFQAGFSMPGPQTAKFLAQRALDRPPATRADRILANR